MKPTNYFEDASQMRKVFQEGYCSHPQAPDGCTKGWIKAHTLPRAGALAQIEEKGHVVSSREAALDIHRNDGRLVPKRTGINIASTFMGFCAAHDSSLFRPIEKDWKEINQETGFLLAYRAMAYELFAKRAARKSNQIMRMMDAGEPLEYQELIQNFAAAHDFGITLALDDLTNWKDRLDQYFVERDFSKMHMYVVEFDSLLPAVSSLAFLPEFDFGGNRVQDLLQPNLDPLTVTLTVKDGRSVAIFVWEEGHSEKALKFVQSYDELEDEVKATAILYMSFLHSENVHLRPSWWGNLSQPQRDSVSNLAAKGMPSAEHQQTKSDLSLANSPFELKAAVLNKQWI